MAQSPDKTPRKSIVIPKGKAKQMAGAVALLAAHYAPLAEVWSELTPTQRDAVMAHSPLLAQVVALGAQFPRGETWR